MLSDLDQTLQNRRKFWKGPKDGRKGAVKSCIGFNQIFGASTGTENGNESRGSDEGNFAQR